MKDIHMPICEESHMHALGCMLASYCVTQEKCVLHSKDCSYPNVCSMHFIRSTSTKDWLSVYATPTLLPVTTALYRVAHQKSPCCISAHDNCPFVHDISPYQRHSKLLTLEKRAWGCLYVRTVKGLASMHCQFSRGHGQMVTLCWGSSENAFSSKNINGSCHF